MRKILEKHDLAIDQSEVKLIYEKVINALIVAIGIVTIFYAFIWVYVIYRWGLNQLTALHLICDLALVVLFLCYRRVSYSSRVWWFSIAIALFTLSDALGIGLLGTWEMMILIPVVIIATFIGSWPAIGAVLFLGSTLTCIAYLNLHDLIPPKLMLQVKSITSTSWIFFLIGFLALGFALIYAISSLTSSILALITTLRQKNTELTRAEMYQKRLVEMLPIAIGMINKEGSVLNVNQKFVQLFGYELNEISTVNEWADKVYPDALYRQKAVEVREKELKKALNSIIEHTTPHIFEITCKDKTVKKVEIDITVIEDDILVSFFDLTELEEAKQKAESLSRVKSHFLNNISHEFRTPLNGIIGCSELLALDTLESRQRIFLDTILSSGRRLTGLVNNILYISNLCSTPTYAAAERLVFSDLIQETLKNHEEEIQQKDLTIIQAFDDNIPEYLLGTKVPLQKVIDVLLDNAIKFTRAGKITITTRLSSHTKENVKILFEVADTGIGISDEFLATMFLPFEQEDMGYTKKHQGAGLGLAIAKNLVTSFFAGDILFERNEPQGSIFMSSFTLKKAAIPPSYARIGTDIPTSILQEQEKSATKTGQNLIVQRHSKIMVVDDDKGNRDLIRGILNTYGYDEIVEGGHGYAAVELFKIEKPAVIILDLQMPKLDGYQASKMIKEYALRNQIKVRIILSTAYLLELTDTKIQAAGIDQVLVKPFSIEDLIEKVELLLAEIKVNGQPCKF